MSRGVNKAILLGNVGREPEIRYTQSGAAVANFSVATGERRKVGGEWQDHTEWHNIVAWGKLAETCSNYLSKGKQVYIEGRIQTRKWDDKDGNTKYSTEIVADQLVLLGRAGGGDRPEYGAPQNQYGSNAGGFPSGGSNNDDDNQGGDQGYDPNDDVPF